MTRSEGAALLLARGWQAEEVATMSDALVDWIATDAPYWHNGIRGIGHRSAPREVPLTPAERCELVEEGRTLARREGMQDATLAALGNIARSKRRP